MAASIIGCSEDLLPEILIHLPPKTLMRLKLVSKQWNFLISDPQFAINHSRKNSDFTVPSGVFLYHPSSRRKNTLSVPFLRTPAGSVPPLSPLLDQLDFAHSRRAFQSCNGLLLCVFFNDNPYRLNAKSLCVICNPTTRGFRVLPTPTPTPTLLDLGTDEWLDGLTLVFNPSESRHYKVVCIKRSTEMLPWEGTQLYIYSSETNGWKLHRSFYPIESHLQFRRGVFSNGAVFWVGWEHTYYYNVKSDKFGVFNVPDKPVPRADFFAESCGRLLYAVAATVFRHKYYVFELDSVGMKWSDGRVVYLNSEEESEQFGINTLGQRAFLIAVSKREDNNWDSVFSLTTPPSTNRLIILNSAMGRRVEIENYGVSDISMLRSCEYVPSLIPV